MKIITWNVNGIRAALGKNALDWTFAQQPDVLCLQEVKAREEQLDEEQRAMLKLPFAWNPAQRPGYSGVTTFYKNKPDEIKLGMKERIRICCGGPRHSDSLSWVPPLQHLYSKWIEKLL